MAPSLWSRGGRERREGEERKRGRRDVKGKEKGEGRGGWQALNISKKTENQNRILNSPDLILPLPIALWAKYECL